MAIDPPVITQEMPPLHPPPTERRSRRRAREVSSRYMLSPAAASPSPSGDHHFAVSPRPSLQHLTIPRTHQRNPSPSPSSFYADENIPAGLPPPPPPPSCARSLENHLGFTNNSNKGNLTQKRRAIRLFGDNVGEESRPPPRKPRPATPFSSSNVQPGFNFNASNDSVQRLASLSQNLQRSMSIGRRKISSVGSKSEPSTPTKSDSLTADDASNGDSSSADLSEFDSCSVCDSPPINNKLRAAPGSVLETRSSMPEADMLHTISMSSRSLHNQNNNLTKSVNRPLGLSITRSVKNVGTCLPPQPPNVKVAVDLKKLKKTEDLHQLKMYHNQLLQWRFVNAKAEQAMKARKVVAEISLCEVASKISEQQEKVSAKRIELEQLKSGKALSSILESQMPYLDEWDHMQEDYASSLSEAIKALQDVALRVPILGNVRANPNEIAEVLDSATNILESITPSVGVFLPEAEGLENVASKLARVVTREKTLIEECGDLLSLVHNLQVTESSLRSQLVQQRRSPQSSDDR